MGIFNSKGQIVKYYENNLEGSYSIIWQGKDNHQNIISSGVCFYKLESKSFRKIRDDNVEIVHYLREIGGFFCARETIGTRNAIYYCGGKNGF